MAICCQKCNYHMEQSEAFGHFSVEMYKIFKEIIVPTIIASYTKRGINDLPYEISENIIIGVLNNTKIECHVCMHYHGWSTTTSMQQPYQHHQIDQAV